MPRRVPTGDSVFASKIVPFLTLWAQGCKLVNVNSAVDGFCESARMAQYRSSAITDRENRLWERERMSGIIPPKRVLFGVKSRRYHSCRGRAGCFHRRGLAVRLDSLKLLTGILEVVGPDAEFEHFLDHR